MAPDQSYLSSNPMKKLKKNIYIDGRRTSISFEGYIWEQLERLGHEERLTSDELFSTIEASRPDDLNISSVIRYLVLKILAMREHAGLETIEELHEQNSPFPSPFYNVLASLKEDAVYIKDTTN